jgi:hypothetical protein
MDVDADQAGLRPDPSTTALSDRPGTAGQGQLFADAFPTYADTDKIPAFRGGRGSGESRSRVLRVAVAVVALCVIAAGAALGLVKAGVIGNNGTPGKGAALTTTTRAAAPTTPLVTPVSSGVGTASYRVDIAAYEVTVATSTGPSWVSIGIAGQRPVFEGILAPGTSHHAVLLGPSAVDIGAGGTKLTITSGRRTATLTPPSAPFTYQLLSKS